MTYDKQSWHTDAGRSGAHVILALDWLADHDLLSDLGRELHALDAGDDAALTADMVSDDGRAFLDAHYAEWTASLSADEAPTTVGLDRRRGEFTKRGS